MDWCSEEEASEWRQDASRELYKCDIETLNPMDRSDFKENTAGPQSSLPDLVEEDKIDIEMSDVILVNYTKISVGTSMEILLAWQKHKRVIVVTPEGMELSPWLHYHTHNIVHDMQSAYDLIIEFKRRIG
jgi:hypothetical protein